MSSVSGVEQQPPFLPGLDDQGACEDGGGGEDQGEGQDKPARRGGQRVAVECACTPPRKLHLTPRQLEDGPVICGLCCAPFEPPEEGQDDAAGEDS
jgi:hypothetical protein